MNRRAVSLVLTPLLTLAIAGCERGLFDDAHDAKRVSIARLRAIDRTDLSSFRKTAGEQTELPTSAEQFAIAKARFEGRASVDLDLEACRMSALERNLDLKVARLDPTIAGERVTEEDARFNAAFTLNANYTDLNQPTSSTLSSSQFNSSSVEPGVRIPLRTGGTATVTLPWSQSETSNSFATLNPSITSDLAFSLSQPLLRGAGRRATTSALRIATYDQQASEARTKLEVIRQLAGVDRSYWRLYSARKQLDVRQQQYELANEQLGRAERRVRAERAAEIEVVRAQAGVAEKLEGIILAQNDVLTQQRELKRIINEPGLPIDADTALVPVTPPDPVEYGFDKPALVQAAVANRMEMLELELQLAADAARVAFQKNQALPLLSLDYTYRVNGLGGSTQDALKMMRDENFQDWTLGLSAEIPLDNEEARARVRQALLQRFQRLASRDARTLAITQEVLESIDQTDAAWQRILAARQSVVLNTRTLQAEQRGFDVGRSTSTNVLDAATRLADAQLAEIRAITDYQIAQVDLAFATGTLLGASKVTFEPTPSPSHDEATPAESPSTAP